MNPFDVDDPMPCIRAWDRVDFLWSTNADNDCLLLGALTELHWHGPSDEHGRRVIRIANPQRIIHADPTAPVWASLAAQIERHGEG